MPAALEIPADAQWQSFNGLIERLIKSSIPLSCSTGSAERSLCTARLRCWELLLSLPKEGGTGPDREERALQNSLALANVGIASAGPSGEQAALLERAADDLLRCSTRLEDPSNTAGAEAVIACTSDNLRLFTEQQGMLSLLLALQGSSEALPTEGMDLGWGSAGSARLQAATCWSKMSSPPAWEPGPTGRRPGLRQQLHDTMMADEPGLCTAFYSPPVIEKPPILNSSNGNTIRTTGKPAENAANGMETGPSEALPAMTLVQSSVPGEDSEALICQEALLALQGVSAAMQRLRRLTSEHRVPLSVAQLLAELAHAAELRQRLDAFVKQCRTAAPRDVSSTTDAIRQGFVAELQCLLETLALAVQRVPEAVQRRRSEEGAPCLEHHPGTEPNISLIELAAHSSAITAELKCLALICRCTVDCQTHDNGGSTRLLQQEAEPFPQGVGLLDYLHKLLTAAGGKTEALLQRLFTAAMKPFAARMRQWLYSDVQFSAPASDELPAFLSHVADNYGRAGHQLRILQKLGRLGKVVLPPLTRTAEEAPVGAEKEKRSPHLLHSFEVAFDRATLLLVAERNRHEDAEQATAVAGFLKRIGQEQTADDLHILASTASQQTDPRDGLTPAVSEGGMAVSEGGMAVSEGEMSDTALEPVELAIDICIAQPIKSRYRSISGACLGYFQAAAGAQQLLEGLQQRFCFSAGDFGQALVEGLCGLADSGSLLRRHDLQSLLDDAVKGSSCGGNGPELSIKLLGAVDGGAANQDADLEGGRLDTSSLASFRAVQLSVDVPFPGSVLVQETSIESYAEVARTLMQVQVVRILVQQLGPWLTQEGPWSGPDLKRLQLMRYQAQHFASALQTFIQGQILGEAWPAFCRRMQEAVQDIVELQEAHSEYLAQCQHACFLTLQTAHLRQELSETLQAVLDFRACLSGMGEKEPDPLSLHACISAFQQHVGSFCLLLSNEPLDGQFEQLLEHLSVNSFYQTV